MEIHVDDKKRLVEIWLTKAERSDIAVLNSLKPVYQKFNAQKYKVGVFLSGDGDLFENTKNLLMINRYRDDAR